MPNDVSLSSCSHKRTTGQLLNRQVSTRMISLVTPVQSITLSIYGYNAAGPSQPRSRSALPESKLEDWTWASSWAGGVSGLIRILESGPEADRQRAMECLDLLEDVEGGIISRLLESERAVIYILSQPIQTNLSTRLLDNPNYALHPNVRSAIPPSHPLYALLSHTVSPTEQREAAWRNLEAGLLPLLILAQGKAEDISAGRITARALLRQLLERAEVHAACADKKDGRCLEAILDVISQRGKDPVTEAHLANTLPRLTVISNILNKTNRPISLSQTYALPIAQALLNTASQIIDNVPADPMTRKLVQPFLPHLPSDSPYHVIFASTPSPLTSAPTPVNADTRRVSRLSTALSSRTPSAYIHSATPAELVNLLAPALYTLLSTAPAPLLDIPSALANPTPESQASAWAGKVYTSNEFREREEARVGLGIKGAKTGGLAVLGGTASAGGIGMGGLSGDSLSPGLGRMSRPASRHVDDFAR